jgi:putative transcriptional regulator
MKADNSLGRLLGIRRKGLHLTQRSLAEKVGVTASYIAFLESGRRKPSLKVAIRLSDVLDLDRRKLLVLAHPEAKLFVAPRARSLPSRDMKPNSSRSAAERRLVACGEIAERDLQILQQLSLLGKTFSAKQLIEILRLIHELPGD